ERLRELFPQARLFSMYGLTECKRCTYLPPEELSHRPESVGIAIPGTEAYVVDELGQRVPPGVVGELMIRGAHVMKGYWADEEATARVLRPGPYPWEKVLHTGDLFRADDDGYLYFVGRKDDIIWTQPPRWSASPRRCAARCSSSCAAGASCSASRAASIPVWSRRSACALSARPTSSASSCPSRTPSPTACAWGEPSQDGSAWRRRSR